MYEDFEDLRDNCPAEIKADIAIDFEHDDPARLAEIWPATADGEFRLYLNQAVSDFWENEVRTRGDVPDDGFAIEIVIDSFNDQDMGSTLYLELHAYCGTDGIGASAWQVFEDDKIERRFAAALAAKAPGLLNDATDAGGVRCVVEVTEVEEL
jgi:hypothetical protein